VVVVGRYEVLTYTGLAAPSYSPRHEPSGLAPANLLLRMAGLAALTAVFLVLGAARSHDTVPGATPRALRRSLSGATRRTAVVGEQPLTSRKTPAMALEPGQRPRIQSAE
jgi:hypothetical protein